MGRLDGIRACVFDAYGTLFDFSSAVARERAALGEKAELVDRLWRQKQIEYTWLRSLMRRYVDFRTVTAEALEWALEAAGVGDAGDVAGRLMRAYETLDPFPEVPEMLRALRGSGLRTAILSNGTPDMLESAAKSAGIRDLLDAILSVDAVRVYKPDPEVYQFATRTLGLPACAAVFVSSNAWDAHGAASFGFPTVWVNRRGAPHERLPGTPVAQLRDLSGLPALVGIGG